jgi:hypothetical protein
MKVRVRLQRALLRAIEDSASALLYVVAVVVSFRAKRRIPDPSSPLLTHGSCRRALDPALPRRSLRAKITVSYAMGGGGRSEEIREVSRGSKSAMPMRKPKKV